MYITACPRVSVYSHTGFLPSTAYKGWSSSYPLPCQFGRGLCRCFRAVPLVLYRWIWGSVENALGFHGPHVGRHLWGARRQYVRRYQDTCCIRHMSPTVVTSQHCQLQCLYDMHAGTGNSGFIQMLPHLGYLDLQGKDPRYLTPVANLYRSSVHLKRKGVGRLCKQTSLPGPQKYVTIKAFEASIEKLGHHFTYCCSPDSRLSRLYHKHSHGTLVLNARALRLKAEATRPCIPYKDCSRGINPPMEAYVHP